MPTYEYACKQCGQHVEVVQTVSDDPLSVCGVCRGELRKVFHPAGILFRGSGFYATDNRKKPETAKGEPTTESKPASGSDKGAGKTSDKDSSKGSSKGSPAPKEKSA